MSDLSQLSDDQILAAANAPMSAAILGQESGNNPKIGNSVDGAVGRAQIEPSTFAQYARPGEDIKNDTDNLAVHNRILADLSNKTGGDPARIAVGYFSGPGNIAPQGSPNPFINDAVDGNGKKTSEYVQDVLGRMPTKVAGPQEPAVQVSMQPDLSNFSDNDILKAAGLPSKSFGQNTADVQGEAGKGIVQGFKGIGAAMDGPTEDQIPVQYDDGGNAYNAKGQLIPEQPLPIENAANIAGNVVRVGTSGVEGGLRTAGLSNRTSQDLTALGTVGFPAAREIRDIGRENGVTLMDAMRDNSGASERTAVAANSNIPSSADLRNMATDKYNAGQEKGAQYSPNITGSFLDQSADSVFPKSSRVADLASDTPSAKLLNSLEGWRGTPMNLQEVLDLDKHIGNLADNESDAITGKMSPEGANLLKIQQNLRDITTNAPPEEMVKQNIAKQPELDAAKETHLTDSVQSKSQLAGQQGGFWRQRTITQAADDAKSLANVRQQISKQQDVVNQMQASIKNAPDIMQQASDSKNAVDNITQGRQLSAAAFKMNDLERIEQKASNANNPIEARKQGFRALANTPSRLRGYTPEEIVAINKAAKTGIITHALNIAGSNLNPILAAEFGGPIGAAVGYGVSRAARTIGSKLQANRGNAVSKLIANRPSVIEAMKENQK